MSDYYVAVDENGRPYIAHAFWNRKGQERKNHKYIAREKVGNRFRYFYTQKEWGAFKKAKSGVKEAARTVADKVKELDNKTRGLLAGPLSGVFRKDAPAATLTPEGTETKIEEKIIPETKIEEEIIPEIKIEEEIIPEIRLKEKDLSKKTEDIKINEEMAQTFDTMLRGITRADALTDEELDAEMDYCVERQQKLLKEQDRRRNNPEYNASDVVGLEILIRQSHERYTDCWVEQECRKFKAGKVVDPELILQAQDGWLTEEQYDVLIKAGLIDEKPEIHRNWFKAW